jgi:N-acetylglucosamine-6-phosphate deacetylase
MELHALVGARIFDGEKLHERKALVLRAGLVEGLVREVDLDAAVPRATLTGGLLAPGFIDAQVNGGGGLMLNDAPDAASMRRMAQAHRLGGTTSLLPTLITDRQDVLERALDAAVTAVAEDQGVAGIHLEGPHLAPARKGAHPAELMRPLTAQDVALYSSYASRVGRLLITLAPEQVQPAQVAALVEAGVIVSLGHSDAQEREARALFDAGARGATHLFNAMSQLSGRAPGLVGASIDHAEVWCGIIADGHHVDAVSLRLAQRAKSASPGPARLFLVTDAMALLGSGRDGFLLHGRKVKRTSEGYCPRLTLEDGTLAGSDLDMATAIRFMMERVGLPLEEALAMATSYPARFLGLSDRGLLKQGLRADLVHLDDSLRVTGTWLGGQPAVMG